MVLHWATVTVETDDGERIHAEVTHDDAAAGTRPTVVLGHGAGGSHAAWFQQVPVLAAAGHRVITWDTRGFGGSTNHNGTCDTEHAVGDLAAALDATGTDRAVVVGQSMGGWWASSFALTHPDRVVALVLTNTVGGLWSDALLAHFGSLASSPALGPTDELGAHPAIHDGLRRRDPALAFLYQQLNTFHEPPMGQVLTALLGTRHDPAAIAALGVPMLWIAGSDDPLFPAALVEPVAAACGAEFTVIADAGHSPYFERAAEWNATLLRFLAQP